MLPVLCCVCGISPLQSPRAEAAAVTPLARVKIDRGKAMGSFLAANFASLFA